MIVSSCFSRKLFGAAVAALFVAAPFAVKLDASGISAAPMVAFAQGVPDPIDPTDLPPGGPIEAPECGIDCGPPEGPIDPPQCEVDCGPVDPPECEVDCGPVDPPECEVDCGPVDPPECEVDCGPIDPPIDECDQKDAPDSCFEPKPEPASQTPDDNDDDVPPSLPKVAEAPVDAKSDAVEFLQNLHCPDVVECVRTVTEDGDMEVTVTSGGPGETTVTTTVSVVDTTVEVEVNLPSGETISSGDLDLGNRDEAEDAVTEVVQTVIGLKVENYNLADNQPVQKSILDMFKEGISSALNISADRLTIQAIREG